MATKEKLNPVNKGGTNNEWGEVNQNAKKVLELKNRIKNSTPVEQFLANEPLEFVNQDNLEQLNKSKVEVEKVQPKVPAKSKTRAVTKTKGELTTKPRKAKSTNIRQFAQVQELENSMIDTSQEERLLINQQEVKKEDDMPVTELVKLASVGLYKLFLKGSSNLLNPLAFLVENKEVLFKAAWILLMPVMFTMLAFSSSASLSSKVTDINVVMQFTYYSVFYFASLFVWISSLVMLKGVYHVCKKTLVDVAKKEKV